MLRLNTLSYRELDIWITLGFDIAIAFYYFLQVTRLPAGIGLYSPEMGDIMTNVISYAIIATIIKHAILKTRGKEEIKDERDYKIDAAANASAYLTLLICSWILVGFVAVNGSKFNSSVLGAFEINAMLIANLLLFSLFITNAVKALSQLYHYCRGI